MGNYQIFGLDMFRERIIVVSEQIDVDLGLSVLSVSVLMELSRYS